MKYEVRGPSVIVIICHSNFSVMVQESNWKQPSPGANTLAAWLSYRLAHRGFSSCDADSSQVCTGQLHQTLDEANLAFLCRLDTGVVFSTMQSGTDFQRGLNAVPPLEEHGVRSILTGIQTSVHF